MDGTPGTSQLFANIQFDEAKKGYDREQVTNFLKELSTKIGELQDMLRESTARAEAAEARAADATKAKVLAETIAAKAKADAESAASAAPSAPVNEVEAAAGMLALAQQTAEAAIAAAEARAKDVLADARSKAAMIVVEVEQEVERIKSRAVEEADALVSSRAADVDAEVTRLTSVRDGLQTDVHVLQSHLDEHRERLRDGVTALAKLLDDGSFDPIGGGDESGPKATKSMFDAPSAPDEGDATIDVTDAAPVSAEAEPAAEPTADASAPVPVIEFVPEPEPAPAPTLNLVAAMTGRDSGPLDGDDDGVTADDETVSSGDDDAGHGSTSAGLTIVTLEDLESDASESAPASAFSSKRIDPETELRAAQVANLLEAPDASVSAEPVISLDGPLFAGPSETSEPPADAEIADVVSHPAAEVELESEAGSDARSEPAPVAATEPEREPEPVAAAEPVAEPVVEVTPVIIAATGTDGVGAPASSVINLTAAKLFGEPVVEGDPTQAFDVLSEDTPAPRLTLQRSDQLPSTGDASPLGEPDADADAAMRAFFEQDLAKLEREQPKGRFRRR